MKPKPDQDRRGYALAFGGGLLLWLAAMAIGGKREAWDSSAYWTVAYPLGIVLAGWLGHAFPRRAWRWGLTVMLSQAVALAATAVDFGMLPLGLVVFAILSLPLVAVATLAARWARRRGTS